MASNHSLNQKLITIVKRIKIYKHLEILKHTLKQLVKLYLEVKPQSI